MLATKIAAFRPKDATDIQLLIGELNIRTREQAKAIVDKFLLLEAQEFWYKIGPNLPATCAIHALAEFLIK